MAIDNSYAVSWLHLATGQPLLTVFGIGGLVYLAVRAHSTASDEDRRWFGFLVLWLLWGMLQLLWPGGGAFGLIILAGPLMIGAAHALGELIRLIPPKEHWQEVGGTAAALTGLLIAIAFWSAALVFSRQFSPHAVQPVLILLVLLLLVFLAYGFWSSWKEAFWLAGTFVASILFLFSISKISQFSYQPSAEPPRGILQEETHQDILRLVTDVETLSAQRTGDPHAMPLQIQMARPMLGAPRTVPMSAEPDPLLGWHFRNMNRLEWTLTPSADGSTAPGAAIVSVNRMDNGEGDSAASYRLPAGYIGSTYAIRSYWQLADLRRPAPGAEISPEAGLWARIAAGFNNQWERQIQPALRWMLYGEVTEMPTMQSVVLWAAGEP